MDHQLTDAPVKPKDLNIRRVEVYRDNRGMTIEVHTPCGTKDSPTIFAKPYFLSPVNVPVQTPQGVRPMPIVVPITATDVYDAFAVAEGQINARAPALVTEQIERMKGEMRKNQLGNINDLGAATRPQH